jgi:hypothetical protein
MKTLKDKLQQEIEAITKHYQTTLDFLIWLGDRNVELSDTCRIDTHGLFTVDIEYPTREDVEKIISTLHVGKWVKEKMGETSLNYISEQPILGNKKLRLWVAQPPNTCQIIEVDTVIPAVPAQPERVEKRKVMICNPAIVSKDEAASI